MTPHQLRDSGQKLAALLASAEGLERFKKQRLADRDVGVEQLGALRDVLVELATVLASDDAAVWARLVPALAALRQPEAPEAALEPPAPAPDEPARVDQPPDPAREDVIAAPPILRDEKPSPWVRLPMPPAPAPPRTAAPLPMAPLASPLQTTASEASASSGRALPFIEADETTREVGFGSRAHPLALSVEEYAALCAERDHDPAATQRIQARYAIDDGRTRAAVDRMFQLLFAADPAEREAWQRHYRRFAELLRRK
jgi:hypothetical protein